jgi:hypothetical protein
MMACDAGADSATSGGSRVSTLPVTLPEQG